MKTTGVRTDFVVTRREEGFVRWRAAQMPNLSSSVQVDRLAERVRLLIVHQDMDLGEMARVRQCCGANRGKLQMCRTSLSRRNYVNKNSSSFAAIRAVRGHSVPLDPPSCGGACRHYILERPTWLSHLSDCVPTRKQTVSVSAVKAVSDRDWKGKGPFRMQTIARIAGASM